MASHSNLRHDLVICVECGSTSDGLDRRAGVSPLAGARPDVRGLGPPANQSCATKRSLPLPGLRLERKRVGIPMTTASDDRLRQSIEISDQLNRSHRESFGRGAGNVKTVIQKGFVTTFLETSTRRQTGAPALVGSYAHRRREIDRRSMSHGAYRPSVVSKSHAPAYRALLPVAGLNRDATSGCWSNSPRWN
jgi:hypothetical protein